MASPPSHPPPLSIPKRPPFASNLSSQSTARRPSSLHPLRQTSFPAEDADARVFSATSARSETGSVGAGSLKSVSHIGKSPGTGRGRGRPRKDRSKETDKASTASGGATTVNVGEKRKRGTTPGSTVGGGAAEADREEDEVDDGVEGGELKGFGTSETEAKNLNVLLSALDPDQFRRYSTMRNVKLRKDTLRKTVNQTLSQSVPPTVITNVSGFTKVFIGEIIELAKQVQAEYAAAWSLPSPAATPPDTSSANSPSQLQPNPTVESPAQVASPANPPPNPNLISTQQTNHRPPFAPHQSPPSIPPYSQGHTSPTNPHTNQNAARPDPYSTPSNPPYMHNHMPNPHFNPNYNGPHPYPPSNPNFPQQQPQSRPTPPPPPPPPPPPLPPRRIPTRPPGIAYWKYENLTLNTNPHLGPLLPDHIREALRRYKRDGEGGGVGAAGLSLDGMGVKGEASWRVGGGLGARRLFG